MTCVNGVSFNDNPISPIQGGEGSWTCVLCDRRGGEAQTQLSEVPSCVHCLEHKLSLSITLAIFGQANDKKLMWPYSTGTIKHLNTVTTCMGTDWRQLLFKVIATWASPVYKG